MLTLRDMIPRELPVILLADRGFGRTELRRFCQRHGLGYVIRIQPKVHIRMGSRRFRLDLHPVRKGQCFQLKDVLYRQHDGLTQHVVACWKRGLPRRRDECWYLMTNLDRPARELVDLYGRRMQIEQFFRDAKSKRNGWSLRDTGLRQPQRLDRLILILALAYLLLVGLGLYVRACRHPERWTSNGRPDEYSVFQIGRFMISHFTIKLPQILNAINQPPKTYKGNWG